MSALCTHQRLRRRRGYIYLKVVEIVGVGSVITGATSSSNYSAVFSQLYILLALRTRAARAIRSDFGDMFLDKTCPLENCQMLDSLPHLLACWELLGAVPRRSPVQYGDVSC